MKSILSTLFALLASSLWCFGDLVFREPWQELRPEVGSVEVVATYHFRNEGSDSITILEIDSSCSCTVADLAKRNYAPGEEGAIEMVFTPGKRQGWQTKQLKVFTDLRKDPYALTLRAYIAPMIELTPSKIQWSMDDLSRKTVKLMVMTEASQHIVEVISSEASMGWDLETVEKGREYALHLQPQEDARPLFGILQIVTDYPPDKPSRHHLTFQVRPAVAAPQ